MTDLIERLQKSAEHVRSTSKGGMEYEARLTEEAAAALEAAREDAAAVNRVLAVVEEFEGCTGAGYRYMAANIRSAIDQARGSGGRA